MEAKPKYFTKAEQTVVVEITPEEYQADLQRGLKADETLTPGRHVFRRGAFLQRHANATATSKIRISINLDSDVLEYFKLRASDPDAAPYQTQINNALRSFMEEEQSNPPSTQASFVQSLLADSRFIDAVARRVAEQRPEYKAES